MNIVPAKKHQASQLAELIDRAGEGIPRFLWGNMADPGQDPLAFGALRAAREEGGFSYRNARVCERNGELLGMCVSYRQPDPYDLSELANYPSVVQPMVALEAKAPGSWYVNALATFRQFEGQGAARLLLEDAEAQARADGCIDMSIIVAEENPRALGLYQHIGFEQIDSLPIVNFPGGDFSGDWLLLTRSL